MITMTHRNTTQIQMMLNTLIKFTNLKITNLKIQIITNKKLEDLIFRRLLTSVILTQQPNIIERIQLFNHGEKATSTYISNKTEQELLLMTKLLINITM
jgi:hypothetical protein